MRKFLPIVIVAALVVLALRYFRPQTPADAPQVAAPTVPAAAPVKVQAPRQIAPPTQIAAPVMPPAPKPVATIAQAAEAAPAPSGTQAELNGVIDDLTTMLQTGDFVGMFEKYASPEDQAKMPPEEKAEMEQEMSRPEAQQVMQGMAQMFQGLKDQTPEINATGDQATYQMTPPAIMLPAGMPTPPPRPMVLEKIDGRWYFKDGDGF